MMENGRVSSLKLGDRSGSFSEPPRCGVSSAENITLENERGNAAKRAYFRSKSRLGSVTVRNEIEVNVGNTKRLRSYLIRIFLPATHCT